MTKKVVAAIFAVFGSVGAAGAVTITNGSFETPGHMTAGFQALADGSTAIDGWVVGGGGVDWVGTGWAASNGSFSLDLAGGTAGSISQTLTGFVVGQTYTITFDLAANPTAFPPMPNGVTVSVGSSSGSFGVFPGAPGGIGWTNNAFTFVAGATSDVLTFAAGNDTPEGPALDNVQIVVQTPPPMGDVPLPAGGVLMLGGVGALALLRRRRR